MKEDIKEKITACRDIAATIIRNEIVKVTKLQDLKRGNSKLMRQKLIAVMISECYAKITINEAKAFAKTGSLRDAPLIKFPYEKYNSPDAYLELTRDEEIAINLIKVVNYLEM